LSLGGAHDIATGLEEAMREELGPGVEVETHIEPLQPLDEPGRDASAQRIAAVREALTEIATKVDLVGASHDVRGRAAGAGGTSAKNASASARVRLATESTCRSSHSRR